MFRVLWVLILAAAALAQPGSTLTVRVTSAAGDAMPVARVDLWPVGLSALTDETGRTVFRELSSGSYHIVVSAPDCVETDSLVQLETADHAQVSVTLSSVRHVLPAVTVTAQRRNQESAYYLHSEILASGARDLPEFLQNVAGLESRADGVPGSQSTVRIGGSAVNQVLLIVDGKVMRNSGTGEPDFSAVPLEWIESIEVHRGNRTELGGQAIGGIVNVVTISAQRPSGFSAAHESAATYGRTTFSGNSSLGSVNSLLRFARIQGPGDFRYRITEDDGVGAYTPNLGREYRRENSDVIRDQLLFKLGTVGTGRTFALSGTLDRAHRGIPGYISPRFTPEARQTVLQQGLNGQARFHSETYSAEGRVSFQRDMRRYEDPDPYSVIHFSEERSAQIEAQVSLDSRIGKTSVAGGAGIGRESLESSRIANGITRRDSWLAWTRLHRPLLSVPTLGFTSAINPGLRFENVEHFGTFLPRVALNWSLQSLIQIQSSVAWSTSYRTPDLYALFWQDDQLARGNPDLRSESSREWTARLAMELRNWSSPQLELEGALQKVRDLIEWRRTPESQWKPFNLRSAKIRTLDVFLTHSAFRGNLSLQTGINWTEARDGSDDRNTGGRYLTFRAPRSWRSTASFRKRGWQATASHRWVFRRPVTDTNSKWLSEYAITDVSLAYTSKISRMLLQPYVALNNFFDTQYRIIRFAPMPGREILIGAKLSSGENL